MTRTSQHRGKPKPQVFDLDEELENLGDLDPNDFDFEDDQETDPSKEDQPKEFDLDENDEELTQDMLDYEKRMWTLIESPDPKKKATGLGILSFIF